LVNHNGVAVGSAKASWPRLIAAKPLSLITMTIAQGRVGSSVARRLLNNIVFTPCSFLGGADATF